MGRPFCRHRKRIFLDGKACEPGQTSFPWIHGVLFSYQDSQGQRSVGAFGGSGRRMRDIDGFSDAKTDRPGGHGIDFGRGVTPLSGRP